VLFSKYGESFKLWRWIFILLLVITSLWMLSTPLRNKAKETIYGKQVINLDSILLKGFKGVRSKDKEDRATLKKLLNIKANNPDEFLKELPSLMEIEIPDEALRLAQSLQENASPMMRAYGAVAMGDFDTAKASTAEAIVRDQNVKKMIILGDKAFKEKNYTGAISWYGEALELQPTSLLLLRNSADTLYKLLERNDWEKYYADTISTLKLALGEEIYNIGGYAYNLGMVNQARRKTEEAKALYWFSLTIFNDTLGADNRYTELVYFMLEGRYFESGTVSELSRLKAWRKRQLLGE